MSQQVNRSDSNELFDIISDLCHGTVHDTDGKNIPSGADGKMHFFLMLEQITNRQNLANNQILGMIRDFTNEAAKRDYDNHNQGPAGYIVPSKPVFRFKRDSLFDVDWEPRNNWERKRIDEQNN